MIFEYRVAIGGANHMKLITIHLPEPYLKDLDELVKEDLYPNRAEAIRIAIRDMLMNEVWGKKKSTETEL